MSEELESEGTMTFWDHLEVLRWSIFRVAIALVIVVVACFIAMPHIFDSFILGPTDGNFFLYRWLSFGGGSASSGKLMPDFSSDFHVDIININVASQFLTHITTSFWMSLVIIFPYLIYEIWKFLKPALYENEEKNVKLAFLCGTVLFFIGCAIGYCVIFPVTFRFLTGYTVGNSITNQISLNSYMSNFLTLVFVMGAVFEIPMLAWVLSRMGLIYKDTLKGIRRYAIVVLMVLAALITPSGDPFTLSLVFLPLYLLYELSIVVVKPRPAEDEDEEETAVQ